MPGHARPCPVVPPCRQTPADPDHAYGAATGSLGSSDISRAAVRAAVARAQRPVVTRPVTRTTTPQPAMMSQPAWLAGTKPVPSGPCRAEAIADPVSATPSDPPTWRLVEATAAATPPSPPPIPHPAALLTARSPHPLPPPPPPPT